MISRREDVNDSAIVAHGILEADDEAALLLDAAQGGSS
jgi:hypothetical protein